MSDAGRIGNSLIEKQKPIRKSADFLMGFYHKIFLTLSHSSAF